MDSSLARAILRPRSIAIIGASGDPAKTSHRPLDYLLRGGYSGAVYPVNPNTSEILGIPTCASIEALPEGIDLAFVLLPTEPAIEAVVACGRHGIPAAVVLAGGFSESGEEGRAREERLRAAAHGAGIRLIGPSSIGLANLHDNIVLTGNAAFAEVPDAPGGTFCASHSGSMIGALMSRGAAAGVAFGGLVSTGAETDLSLGSLCEAALDDDRIDSFLLFLESMRHAADLRRFALGAARRGKPVLAMKLGRSESAAELAVSHTGAIAGDDALADAFLADCGIARVETLDALLEAGRLLARIPPRTNDAVPKVGIVTTTGGGAALLVDQLGLRGVDVQGPDTATLARIAATGTAPAPGRIVDLTLAGTRPEVMSPALEAMLADGGYDLVIAVVGSSARFQPDLALEPVVALAERHNRLAAFVVPEAPEALERLRAAGVPCFRSPESCADSVAAALSRRPARDVPFASLPQHLTPMDEAEGYDLLGRLGVQFPAFAVATGTEPVPDLYPAAVKVLSSRIGHKTDVGGVILNVQDAADLAAAREKISASLACHRPDLTADRFLVQSMAGGAVGEVLVGYRIAPDVGAVVVLAAGGVLAELHKDRAIRMAPVDLQTARAMIAEVRSMAILTGFRGAEPGDLTALAETIVAISKVGAADPGIAELEVNPLLVMPQGQGVRAVDVLAFRGAE